MTRFESWDALWRFVVVIPGIGKVRADGFVSAMKAQRRAIRCMAKTGVLGAIELEAILPDE